jgi:hypothetical protein
MSTPREEFRTVDEIVKEMREAAEYEMKLFGERAFANVRSTNVLAILEERDALKAKLAKARERISNLEEGIGPCGCDLGACEQYPEIGVVYYGRLCRDSRAELESDMPKEAAK